MRLDVQVGDSIVYRSSGYARTPQIVSVIRLTKTQAICEGGIRFMLDSGKKVGSSGFYHTAGRKATPEDIEEIKMAERIRRANNRLQDIKATEKNIEVVEAFITASDRSTKDK